MKIQDSKQKSISNIFPVTSMVLSDKTMIEMVYDQEKGETSLVNWKNGETKTSDSFRLKADWKITPYHSSNPLLHRRIILFPKELKEYSDEHALIDRIRSFIHRYVHVSEVFELISIYYVLLTWIYDT